MPYNKMSFDTKRWGKIVRIPKQTARKLYNEGKTILVNSCNFYPENMYSPAIELNKEEILKKYGLDYQDKEYTFDGTINEYEFYNCPNSETGLYASFYVKEEDLK